MSFLYEEINSARKFGVTAEVPTYISDNLSSRIVLRDYQNDAFKNTVIYLEGPLSKNKQTHILYHMATGSGKTVIMAMDILYYYKKGYRNFLFFTNQTNIVSKTKINFLEKASLKYLFANTISIDGISVPIKEVVNFEESDSSAINICFNTVQGIHSSLSLIKEGALSIEDFENEKIVLIADEAHHLNSTTAKDKEENEDNLTWEDTVNKIFYANKDNVLLEFTATCDVKDPNVRGKYLDKIVFNFDLKEFRKAGYTKEFYNLRSNAQKTTKTLQAIIISEYRKLIFESKGISIKPVVLLKSKTINESNGFYKEFYDFLNKATPEIVESIKADNKSNPIFCNAFSFFDSVGVDSEKLLDLIKLDFSIEHSVNMNELNDRNEFIVNNLDERDNHYRLIFIVDKLTEGWDVLSLFDIVRLYETRQGGAKGSVSKYTIKEAQLIGRGARYCPFAFEDGQPKEKRKYSDYDNPLAICETLLYHCMDDSKYIDEIKRALKQTGLLPENEPVKVEYKIKNDFKSTPIYQEGFVFLNKRVEKNRSEVHALPEKIRTQGISFKCRSGITLSQNLMDDSKNNKGLDFKDLPPVKMSNIEHSILWKAYRCFNSTLSFDRLKKQFPNLQSTKEFLLSDNYLGLFPITFFTIGGKQPSQEDKLEACKNVLQIVSDYVGSIEITYVGTKEFYAQPIRTAFSDRTRLINREKDDESWGAGVSQNDYLVDDRYRFNLFDKDWYVYNDNFGTSEEKKFVKYFSTLIDSLKKHFKSIYLIRNEIQVAIYSFEDGSKFEPDYVLILERKREGKKNLYINMFVEPKGEHLLQKDGWKNTLMLQLKNNAIPIVKFVDDNDYVIWGTPLYNENATKEDFEQYFNTSIDEMCKM